MKRLGVERKVSTRELAIGGARDYVQDQVGQSSSKGIAKQYALSETLAHRLRQRYGHLPDLLATVASTAENQRNLSTLPDYCRGEIQHICENELVCHLDDIVFRRSTIALEGYASTEVINEIADIAAIALEWNNETKLQEIDQCCRRVARHTGDN